MSYQILLRRQAYKALEWRMSRGIVSGEALLCAGNI